MALYSSLGPNALVPTPSLTSQDYSLVTMGVNKEYCWSAQSCILISKWYPSVNPFIFRYQKYY